MAAKFYGSVILVTWRVLYSTNGSFMSAQLDKLIYQELHLKKAKQITPMFCKSAFIQQ